MTQGRACDGKGGESSGQERSGCCKGIAENGRGAGKRARSRWFRVGWPRGGAWFGIRPCR